MEIPYINYHDEAERIRIAQECNRAMKVMFNQASYDQTAARLLCEIALMALVSPSDVVLANQEKIKTAMRLAQDY